MQLADLPCDPRPDRPSGRRDFVLALLVGPELAIRLTACSCLSCANEYFASSQICPACDTDLQGQDDIVQTTLQPTSDYRTTALAGLSPSIIVDIASRALNFFSVRYTRCTT